MNEERKRILQMLADGKISLEQAGELLEVLEEQPVAVGAYAAAPPRPAWQPRSRSSEARRATLNQLAEARAHGVTPRYMREMGELGYEGLTLRELIVLRDHGVSAEYIRQMRDLELGDLSMQDVVKLRNHGVDPSFVREMRDMGFDGMSASDLCTLRDHGVTTDFMREMRDLGLLDLSPEQVMHASLQRLGATEDDEGIDAELEAEDELEPEL
jgi:hypothetical protein